MLHVGIIGGGIAGLTCALAMARAGLNVSLHERAPKLEEVGAGIQLSPNATKILFKLGMTSALNAVASAPRAIDVYGGVDASLIASIPLGATAEKRYGAPYYVIHRADLQRILANACERENRVEITLGSEIGAIKQTQTGAFIGGDQYDVVVAADGVNSATRRQLFNVDAEPSGLTAWRTTVAMDERPAFYSRAKTTLCIAPDSHLVTYPIAAGRELNAVAILPDGLNPSDGFAHWSPKTLELFRQGDWLPWPLKAVPPLHTWISGRTVLIGDAAHAMLPFAAQGGACAIEDASTLADALSSAENLNEALAAWQRHRKKRAEAIAATAVRNRRIYHLSGIPAQARNLVMKALGSERLIARQDWIYGY
ncbi:MAG: FAD-dependent monooxygenase [Pseudomonadota bacterium]